LGKNGEKFHFPTNFSATYLQFSGVNLHVPNPTIGISFPLFSVTVACVVFVVVGEGRWKEREGEALREREETAFSTFVWKERGKGVGEENASERSTTSEIESRRAAALSLEEQKNYLEGKKLEKIGKKLGEIPLSN